eukprot:GFUD01107642.1.p1 GENE.GFUD01107642.1~~GFUD01107642.1.p1  ORF type:complete len:332 (-),score=125.63 GFUD01107642.1:466-1461(-)
MASDVECITLDSDEGEQGGSGTGNSNSVPVYREEQMVRCNLCVDPGLLPVEEDRAAHRRKVHGNKLFYCDVCNPGEKGAKGFEEFADIVKHVARENGISEKDKVNLHEMIRVPAKAEHLKIFRCKFCPGEGMKFVGLTEDTFLDHIYNLHGTKAPRRKPEKLSRECRVCGGCWQTDAELGRHISLEHLQGGEQNTAPFAGFGPRGVESEDSDSEEEEEEDYEVEKILDKREEKGITKYLIKWVGYDKEEDNTWEPQDNLGCADKIKQFDENLTGPSPHCVELPEDVVDKIAELDLELSEGDITQKGYEKKRAKLLAQNKDDKGEKLSAAAC